MAAIWSGHGYQIDKGDYGWVVSRTLVNQNTGVEYQSGNTYHGSIEQACEKVAREVSGRDAGTLREFVAQMKALVEELRPVRRAHKR